VNREAVNVRRPEKETLPKLFYKGAHQATLDPLAARRPEAGLFMWSEQQQSAEQVVSGNPTYNNTSAAALLSYDVAHSIPWDWRVSLYTWTKGIASGVYLVAALLVLFGLIQPESFLWLWYVPVIGGAFLGLTGLLLIWDLEHPARFYMIFTRAQWRSWLVKGAFIIAGYSLVLLLHFVASLIGSTSVQSWLMIAGIPLSALTAVYTAYLFAQAKARDLWQNPLLPPHLLIQAAILGAAVLMPFANLILDFERASYGRSHPGAPVSEFPRYAEIAPLSWIVLAGVVIHVLMIWGEVSLTHGSAHARVATWEMTRGRYRRYFWCGVLLPLLSVVGIIGAANLVWVLPAISLFTLAILLLLLGMMLYEHAYVQAGQSVPLA
jgi:formate-dependent nitrite reductase membrane component NrfD